MTFTDEQVKELRKKLDPKHVKSRSQSGRNLSYVEGWHVISEANRIFGFGEWSRETIDLIENTPPTKNQKENSVVSFRAKVRIHVNGCYRDGVGFGEGISASIHQAYESAIKEAETDAMKRALMTFGNQFGLALYDKDQGNVGVDEKLTPQQKWLKETQLNMANVTTPEALREFQSKKETKEAVESLNELQKKWYDELIGKVSARVGAINTDAAFDEMKKQIEAGDTIEAVKYVFDSFVGGQEVGGVKFADLPESGRKNLEKICADKIAQMSQAPLDNEAPF